MKYYKLITSLNIKDLGVYPQSTTPKMYWETIDLLNLDGTIKEDYKLPHIILEPKAKYSTFMNSVTIGMKSFLTFKNHFLDSLKEFNISEFKIWDLEMTHNNKIVTDYCLFRLVNSIENEVLDFKKSNFCVGKPFIKEDREKIDINSYNEYVNISFLLRKENTGKWIIPEKLVFDFSNIKQDMIRISNIYLFSNGYFVSEKFKSRYEESRYTGIEFKEIETIDKSIEVKY